jgi:hypothetical protein
MISKTTFTLTELALLQAMITEQYILLHFMPKGSTKIWAAVNSKHLILKNQLIYPKEYEAISKWVSLYALEERGLVGVRKFIVKDPDWLQIMAYNLVRSGQMILYADTIVCRTFAEILDMNLENEPIVLTGVDDSLIQILSKVSKHSVKKTPDVNVYSMANLSAVMSRVKYMLEHVLDDCIICGGSSTDGFRFTSCCSRGIHLNCMPTCNQLFGFNACPLKCPKSAKIPFTTTEDITEWEAAYASIEEILYRKDATTRLVQSKKDELESIKNAKKYKEDAKKWEDKFTESRKEIDAILKAHPEIHLNPEQMPELIARAQEEEKKQKQDKKVVDDE